MVQNTGTANACNVVIGATATTADIYLAPGDSLVLRQEAGALAPGGFISALSTSGTTVAWISY